MSNDIFSQIANADLKNNWVSLSSKDGHTTLVLEKKTTAKSFLYGFVKVITFGLYNREQQGISKVAKYSLKHMNEGNSANRVISSNKFTRFPNNKDAAAFTNKIHNPLTNNKVSESSSPTLMEIVMGSQNPQEQTVNSLMGSGFEAFKNDLLTKNEENITPFGIALARGHMAVVGKLFPVPARDVSFTEEQKKIIEDEVAGLLAMLGSVTSRAEIYEACGGNNDYDKLNHIVSALHALAINGVDVKSAYESLPEKVRAKLPMQISWIANVDRGLGISMQDDFSKRFEGSDAKGLKQQLDQAFPNPATGTFIVLRESHDPIQIIENFLKTPTEDSQKRMAGLIDAFSPYASYDTIDFQNDKYGEVLHRLIELSQQEQDETIRSLLNNLIMKNPDLLNKKNGKGETALQVLERMDPGIKEVLPARFFDITTRKGLKYHLEAQGREFEKQAIDASSLSPAELAANPEVLKDLPKAVTDELTSGGTPGDSSL